MSNSSSNKATNKFKSALLNKRTLPSTDDRIMGRMLITMGLTIVAVAFLIVIRNVTVGGMLLQGWIYGNIYPWFRFVAIALFVLSICWFVYSRFFALRDERESLFTSFGLVICMGCVAFASWYLYAGDNLYPTMVFFIVVGVVAILYQMLSPMAFRLTVLACLGAGMWWFVSTSDKVIGNIGLYLIAAVIVAVFVALKISDGKYPKEKEVKVPLIPAFLVLAALCVATAVISCVLPAVLPYAVYAYPALLLITGILCTVNRR